MKKNDGSSWKRVGRFRHPNSLHYEMIDNYQFKKNATFFRKRANKLRFAAVGSEDTGSDEWRNFPLRTPSRS
jgi:hypothetical protein